MAVTVLSSVARGILTTVDCPITAGFASFLAPGGVPARDRMVNVVREVNVGTVATFAYRAIPCLRGLLVGI